MTSSGSFHSLTEKRSWALHREVARRLSTHPELLERARRRVEGWLQNPGEHPYAQPWLELLALDRPALERALCDTGPNMSTLRQASPFAGALDSKTRWSILKHPDLRP